MNKNMDQNKSEAPILLQKGSLCFAGNFDVYLLMLKLKGLKKEDVDADFYSNSDIKYTMPVFYFIKSPDLDGGKEWHYDHHEKNERPPYENVYMMGYESVHKVNGYNKRVRTSGLMFMVNVHKMGSAQFEEFAANIKNYDSETQIKMLEKAGYKKFTVKLGNRHGAHLSRPQNPLELVDENGKSVYSFSEIYSSVTHDEKGMGEYIIMAHHSPFIDELCCNAGLNSVIILNKNAEMKYRGNNNDESPFCKVSNKDPLTFYCEPGSKVAIDILSKCQDAEKYHEPENKGKYHEFYSATIVFMSPKLVKEYQENLDNVDTYKTMKEFIKSYKENEDYFSIKLSECSNLRIEQLLFAQKEFSDTWEKFVAFMEKIGVKEKSNNEKEKNKIDNPEDHLNVFMQYLKNHWPRIFKFVNAICNFFSGSKNKSKNGNKISLGNVINKGKQTHSLIDKTSTLSSRKYATDEPQNMETSEILK